MAGAKIFIPFVLQPLAHRSPRKHQQQHVSHCSLLVEIYHLSQQRLPFHSAIGLQICAVERKGSCLQVLGTTKFNSQREGRVAYKMHNRNLYEQNNPTQWLRCLFIHEFQCCLIAVQPATYVSLGCFADSGKRPRPLPILIANKRNQIDWYNLKKTVQACAEEARQRGYEFAFALITAMYCF